MIGTLRKHSQSLWIVIIIVIVISFVYFFTPEVENMNDAPQVDYGTLYGQKLTRPDGLAARREANIGIALQTGRWPDDSRFRDQVTQIANQRLLLSANVKREGIVVPESAVIAFIRQQFSDPSTGKFNESFYDGFLNVLKQQGGVTEADFEAYAANEVAIRHLSELHGLGGKLVSTRAAESIFRRENEQREARIVFLNKSNYFDFVTLDTNAVTQYFTNRINTYRIPERVVVNYVFFGFSNYLAEAKTELAKETNLTTRIEAEYTERGTNAFQTADGEAMTAEAAKKEIEAEFADTKAQEICEKAAYAFANEVFAIADVRAENLSNIAKQHGYPVLETQPFTELDGPKDLDTPGNFASTAFRLSPTEPLASPLLWTEGIYLLAYNRSLASEPAQLTNVWDEVVEDYRESQARESMSQAGSKIAVELVAGLASGKQFKDLVPTNGVSVVDVPAFSRQTRSIPQVEDLGLAPSSIISTAFDLNPGTSSGFIPGGNGGYIVHTLRKVSVTDAELTAALPEFLQDFRSERANLAFQDWFRVEFLASGIAPSTPQNQPAQ